ncbi:MAG TPA: hypothetical protein VK421_06860 [Pyrinomonadaceae bacterium]|nr:hypothetical protein [Pyrinomonadaceae bacterium]
MTLEEHNKTLGILHIVYGGLHTLLMLLILGVMFFVFRAVGTEPNAPPAAFFLMFAIFGGFFALIYTVPSYVAGYAMLKRKPWARVAAIIAAVVEVMNVPFGTAIGIYALWFLFGKGEAFYKGDALSSAPRASLGEPRHAPNSEWFQGARGERASEGGREYVPSGQPPDWRGE